MFVCIKENESMEVEISSTLENVDRVVSLVEDFITSYGDYNPSSINQVIRELLLNAIEHGNQNDLEKNVQVQLLILNKERVVIQVLDEGPGLPENTLPITKEMQAGDARSRGLALVNSLADELKVGESGKTIQAYLPLQKQFDWGVIRGEQVMVIEPLQDISASRLEGLRALLFEWLEGSQEKLVFSLKHVTAIDSVSLSLFVVFAKHLREYSKTEGFSFTNVTPDIAQLFRLTQIYKLFQIEEKK